jgi:hypothetical protein
MCYEESFFQRWARKRAERQKPAAEVARDTQKQPTQPRPAPTTTANPGKSRPREREVEIVE